MSHLLSQRHQFRLVLCGHKAVEVGAVCVVLMVQGHLSEVTLGHVAIAARTGLLGAFVFSLVIAYTPIGKRIDHLAEAFLRRPHVTVAV